MDNDGDSVLAYFESRGFEIRIEERDLHAGYIARGEPGRASFFAEYLCDFLRDGAIVAQQYAQGETREDVLKQAKRRSGSEQE